MDFIINRYKRFIIFINKVIARAQAKFFNLKLKIKDFLIYNYKILIVKNYKLILFIRIDNAKKYIILKKKL